MGVAAQDTVAAVQGWQPHGDHGRHQVDLREADIVDKAEIAIFALWGGVEVKVPPTWRVRVSGLPLMGGWDDKTTLPLQDGAPELIVHVTAIMGGAEIKS